ncbi:hypothetical protein VNO80_16888 [Phaseolus coccineus]|uniref:SUZ domain-containing protein n=1 Tax=Phaseolus coccineus TaxID=3886 RepID=A0AAN9MMV0_PHACN
MVQDSALDGQGTRIMVKKLAESRYLVVCLSEIIPVKQLENDKLEQIKISIRPKPNGTSLNKANEVGKKNNVLRNVEERKEEYDRARARIFLVDINSTRLAIFKDRKKDRSDPDYDCNYGRYARGIPPSSLNLMAFNLRQVHYDIVGERNIERW